MPRSLIEKKKKKGILKSRRKYYFIILQSLILGEYEMLFISNLNYCELSLPLMANINKMKMSLSYSIYYCSNSVVISIGWSILFYFFCKKIFLFHI